MNNSTQYKTGRAFIGYLVSQTPSNAVNYVIGCLRTGDSTSQAWSLLEDAYGENWGFPPAEIPHRIFHAINKLAEHYFGGGTPPIPNEGGDS